MSNNNEVNGMIVRRDSGIAHFLPIPERRIKYKGGRVSITKLPINLRYLQKRDSTIIQRLEESQGNRIEYSLPKDEFKQVAKQYVRAYFQKLRTSKNKEESSLADIVFEDEETNPDEIDYLSDDDEIE
ncbi:hypothetical protein CMI45_02065 [Candidatus Pacearchaeota archaeon]|nr:hypothetical protein [Candidatus Pacearchaeota archaeon]|tara:strand:- start:828 stop:1211 length:384 start_codon:yes stop_codon:yes gene_type:complete